MKIDLNTPLVSYNDAPILVSDAPNAEPATLRSVFERALVSYDGGPADSAEAKYERYKLLRRIHSADATLDASLEELTSIKAIVGKMFGAVVVGAVFDSLENE